MILKLMKQTKCCTVLTNVQKFHDTINISTCRMKWWNNKNFNIECYSTLQTRSSDFLSIDRYPYFTIIILALRRKTESAKWRLKKVSKWRLKKEEGCKYIKLWLIFISSVNSFMRLLALLCTTLNYLH